MGTLKGMSEQKTQCTCCRFNHSQHKTFAAAVYGTDIKVSLQARDIGSHQPRVQKYVSKQNESILDILVFDKWQSHLWGIAIRAQLLKEIYSTNVRPGIINCYFI